VPFRSDVHALRALASVFVLVYHVNQDVLPGGFSGVDIFYVISGFVIFRGLFADLDAASTLSFYKRRLFRIFPIIIVTTGLTLIAGFLLMTPDELARLAGSALASLFSVSNFYFADRLAISPRPSTPRRSSTSDRSPSRNSSTS
jgi:peptidoglycan/LPS O-acetylase OafA/YrhL